MRKLVYDSRGTWENLIFPVKPLTIYSLCTLIAFVLFSSVVFSQQASLTQKQNKDLRKTAHLNWSSGNTSENANWKISDEIVIQNPNTLNKIAMPPQKATLDQVRNGSAASPNSPGAWEHGNLNGSQAHYAEKWSVAYRLVLTGMPSGTHTATIEWDVKQSDKNALDYITHYNNLDNGVGSHLNTFGHLKEVIDPTIGYSGMGSRSQFQLDPPPNDVPANSFNALPNDSLKQMSIWHGTITDVTYGTAPDLTLATSTQQATIEFTVPAQTPANATTTVIISWGGHIASESDWGVGQSASSISGSPYHTRLIDLDGSGGNQDRSLSADAVLDPPPCALTGNSPVECNTQNTYSSGMTTLDPLYTFAWLLIDNTSGATFNGSTTSITSVSVNSGSATPAGGGACGTGYTVKLSIRKNGTEVSSCIKVVTVQDTGAPFISASGTTNAIAGCNPSTAAINAALGSATASDACGTPSVSQNDGPVTGTCSRSQTRTFTATDACGNTATTSRTVTWTVDQTVPVITVAKAGDPTSLGCNPSSATIDAALGSASASDGCGLGTNTVQVTTDNVQSSGCGRSQTRRWTATDGCGNTATASRTVTWTFDQTAPTVTANGDNTPLPCNPNSAQINAALGSATASDNCSGSLTPTVSNGAIQSNGCGRSQTRTFTATDGCLNSAAVSRTATWTVDVTPPVITCPPDAHVQCTTGNTAPAATGSATASDNCGGTPAIEFSDANSGTSCNRRVITRTWKATDACGNSATCVQHIIVADDIPPVINCGTIPVSATDNCSSTANIILYQTGSVYTAIDESGNISTLDCSGQVARVSSTQELNTSSAVADGNIKDFKVKAIPNPFSDKIKFVVTSPVAGRGNLEVYNMMGQKVKTVYQGFITKGTQTFELSLPPQEVANLVYVLRIGDKKMTGKILQLNR